MSSAICFNLAQSKILSSGNGLSYTIKDAFKIYIESFTIHLELQMCVYMYWWIKKQFSTVHILLMKEPFFELHTFPQNPYSPVCISTGFGSYFDRKDFILSPFDFSKWNTFAQAPCRHHLSFSREFSALTKRTNFPPICIILFEN